MKRPAKYSLKHIATLLREADEVEKEPGEDSIDAQIDGYFADFEKEGKNVKAEGKDFRRFMKRFLLEAEEDEEKDKEGEEEEKKDEEGEEGEKEEPKEPKKLTVEDINIDSFADGVVRLVDNYDSLLEIRNTIMRRAVNFLGKNYELDVTDAFKESLAERHGLEIGKSKFDEEEDFQPPAADRSGMSPGGA